MMRASPARARASAWRWALLLVVALTPLASPALAREPAGACISGDPVLQIWPREGDGYITLAQRYAVREESWRKIRAANRKRSVQVGRPVRIPLELLRPEHRRFTLATLFPEDGYGDGGWAHLVDRGPGKACREDLGRLATWYTGDPKHAADIGKLNDVADGRPRSGQIVWIPREMLLPMFIPEKEPADSELSYGRDEAGAFAEYHLRPGEALYSAVVIRFTGRLDADEVNQTVGDIARRNEIGDVRDIPIGFPIKIPQEMLLPQYLPPGDPTRIAYESELKETLSHHVTARARRLGGVYVILDPGHGGVDVGTTKGGLDEDEYVYDVMCRVKERLDRDTDAMTLTTLEDRVTGYRARDARTLPRDRNEVIRTTPPYVHEDPNRRAVGVNLRWYLANSYYRRLVEGGTDPEKVVFVSLHADSLHASLNGAMAYIPGEKYRTGKYGSGNATYAVYEEVREKTFVSFERADRVRAEGLSREFADQLMKTFHSHGIPVHDYQPVRNRVIRRRRTWVPAVIRCSEVPISVLVEVVNLNNKGDRRNLRDAGFRDRLAAAFVDALLAFYEPDRPPSASPTTPTARARAGR